MAHRPRPFRTSGRSPRRNGLAALPLSAIVSAMRGVPAGLVLAGAFMASSTYAADAAPTAPSRTIYNIPAGPLGAALSEFASQARVTVQIDSRLVEGLSTRGINGTYSVNEGFAALLEGTRLETTESNPGVFLVRARTQPAPSTQTEAAVLPAVKVQDTAVDATTEGTGSYAAQGATILKGAESLKDIPQSVTVITRQQIDDQRLDTIYDALRNTPGITLLPRSNGGNDIYSRGFSNTTIQYDGVPLQRGISTGNNFQASSVYVDRIEVLRGAQGLLQGAGDAGGAVNLVRKRGLKETAFNAELRAGSWNNFGGRFEAGGPLDGEARLRSRVVIDYEDKDSFLDTIYERNLNVYGALDFDLTPDTTLGAGVAYTHTKGNRTAVYGVPRYADGTTLDIPRSTCLCADWNDAKQNEVQAFVDMEHRFSPDWKLKLTGVYVDESWDSIMSFGSYANFVAVGGSTVPGWGFIYDMNGKNLGVDAKISGSFHALGIAQEIVLGAVHSRQKRDDSWDGYYRYTTYDVFNVNHDALRLDASTPTNFYQSTTRETQKGVYAMLRSHLTDDLALILGTRVSWYSYTSTSSTSDKSANGKVTPYAGLIYALNPQWSVYASYADIFSPQTATNAQLEVLPPIIGVNYEAGVKGELFDGALNTSLAVFRVDQRNRAITDYDSSPVCGSSGTSYCSRAAGRVRSEGVELEGHGQLMPGWQLSGGYTYSRNKYLEDSNASLIGKPFEPTTPEHIFRLWSDWRLPRSLSKLSLGAGVNYRSKQEVVSTSAFYNTHRVLQGGYSVWNARVGYEINEHWSASLNVNNLFDKYYYSGISSTGGFNYFGDPQNLLLTVRAHF